MTPGRPIPLHFTSQQRAFLQAVASGQHLYLRATAGAGKTTTIKEAAWHLPAVARSSAAYFVYNRTARDSVGQGLPEGLKVSTIHAHGLGQLYRLRRGEGLQMDTGKSLKLASQLYPQERIGRRRQLARLWDEAREKLITPASGKGQLSSLATKYEYPVERLGELLLQFQAASLSDWREGGHPDFTDQLWLPLQLKAGFGCLKALFVDEAQDLTPLRQAYVAHVVGIGSPYVGQLILVGDPDQAVYQYAGAEPAVMKRLATRIGAQEYPLSVTWRCPKSHVAVARHASRFIEAAPAAESGVIEHVEASQLAHRLQAGQTVLCRTNAPLVRLALELLMVQTSVDLRGRDLNALLGKVLEEIFEDKVQLTQLQAQARTEKVLEKRLAPLKVARAEGDSDAKRRIQEEKDLFECVQLLFGDHKQVKKAAVQELITRLTQPGGDVLLSTIHRAKGLEWRDVTLLYPENLPSGFGSRDEERCVLFVGLTRSFHTLRFAYGEEAWKKNWRIAPFSSETSGWRWLDDMDERDTELKLPTEQVYQPPDLLAFDDVRHAGVAALVNHLVQAVSASAKPLPPETGSKAAKKTQRKQGKATSPLSTTDRDRLVLAQAALQKRKEGITATREPQRVAGIPVLELEGDLFGGTDVTSVALVRSLLLSLAHCGRFEVERWAAEGLQVLQDWDDLQQIWIDRGYFLTLETFVKTLRRQGNRPQELVIFLPMIYGLRAAKARVLENTGEEIILSCEGQNFAFAVSTGELSDAPFKLLQPFVRVTALNAYIAQAT